MLIRHSLIYVVAKAVPGLLGMATTILLTHLLSPAQYGLYGLALVVMTFGASAGFEWLQISLLRFFHSRREDPRVIATIVQMFVMTIVLTAVLLVVLLLLNVFPSSDRPMYVIGFVLIWSFGWFELVAKIEIANFRPRRYLIMNFARAGCILTGAVAAARLTHDPFWTAAGTGAGILAGSCFRQTSRQRFGPNSFDTVLARQIVAFGLPLAVSMAMNGLTLSGTRAMIEWLQSPEALGHYTAAFSLIQNTLVVMASGIAAASYQFAVRAVDSGDVAKAQAQLIDNATLLLAILAPAAIGAALTADGIAATLVGRDYADGVAGLTPWLAVGTFFGTIRANYLDHAFQLGRQPYRQVRVLSLSGLLSMALAFWLIPSLGPKGAAIAMTVAMIVSCVHARVEGNSAYPLPLPTNAAGKILLACGVMAVSIRMVGGGTPAHFAVQVLGCVTELLEPQVDHDCGQVGKPHPTAPGFIASKCDPGLIFKAGEDILDMMAPGVDDLVPRGWIEHRFLRRGVNGTPLCGKIGPQFCRDIASVECCIAGRNIAHECPGIAQIRVVCGAVDEPKYPAEAIRAGVDFGTDPAARATQRFRLGGAARRTRGRAMRLASGAVHQHQSIGWQGRTEVFKYQLPPAAHTPAAKAVIHARPMAQVWWKVTPGCARSLDPQNRFHKTTQTCFIALPGMGHPLDRKPQRHPLGIIQTAPDHGHVPPEVPKTSRSTRPPIYSSRYGQQIQSHSLVGATVYGLSLTSLNVLRLRDHLWRYFFTQRLRWVK